MEIELLRDLIIIISGLVITATAIFIAIISYSVYRRVNSVLQSAKTSASKIEALTTVTTDEIGQPLVKVAGVVQAIALGLRAISKMTKKGG